MSSEKNGISNINETNKIKNKLKNKKLNNEKYTKKINEDDGVENSDVNRSNVVTSSELPQDSHNVDISLEEDDEETPSISTITQNNKNNKSTNKLNGKYETFMERHQITNKARKPFLVLIILLTILLIVLIGLISFWPRIPFYMKADICMDRECIESSKQILLWANTSIDACYNPHKWACGNFKNEFLDNQFPEFSDGEWNSEAYREYHEILEIHSFVGKLPSASLSYSAQLMLKGLHSTCMDTLDKSQGDTSLRQAILTLSGWYYGEGYVPHIWDYKTVLKRIQSQFGIFPFFRVSVENRITEPFGNIITISEGELGLPHKFFYNLEPHNKVIIAYKMLIRDFAINFGIVSDKAKRFAEEVFYYEKRIINVIPEQHSNEIIRLGELQRLTPLLPIMEIIQIIFSRTKLTDTTPILVKNMELLKEMSIILSTSDMIPLNGFIVWSLARHYLPFMSREYIAALEEFNSVFYGYNVSPSRWYFCSKLVKDWVPLAIDSLQRNPNLIQMKPDSNQNNRNNEYNAERLISIDNNQEVLRIIFHHLRQQFKKLIDESVLINLEATNFMLDKLSKVQLHIGIPTEILKDDKYINKYYEKFYLQKLHFLNNLESYWTFQKTKMEQQLSLHSNYTEKLISYLYPTIKTNQKMVMYSVDLNTIIISEDALKPAYYHYKYPISLNFARIGVDLSAALLEAIFSYGEQYKQYFYTTSRQQVNANALQSFNFIDINCINSKFNDSENIPHKAKVDLTTQIITGRFVYDALTSFIDHIKNNRPIEDTPLPVTVTYDLLGLNTVKRQPGLRMYDHDQLFSITFMQRHCSLTQSPSYQYFKPLIENVISERNIFNVIWDEIPNLTKSMGCSTSELNCKTIL